MNRKQTIAFILLFIMSSYVIHGFVFAYFDKHHHESAIEYMYEIDTPSSHNDVCDLHFVFHQLFLVPESFVVYDYKPTSSSYQKEEQRYCFYSCLELFRPPIS